MGFIIKKCSVITITSTKPKRQTTVINIPTQAPSHLQCCSHALQLARKKRRPGYLVGLKKTRKAAGYHSLIFQPQPLPQTNNKMGCTTSAKNWKDDYDAVVADVSSANFAFWIRRINITFHVISLMS